MLNNRASVLIADDHTLMAELCKKLLETDFDVVGIVNNGRAMVQLALQLTPDVIIVDITMPILNGLDAACKVKQGFPPIKLLFLTMHDDFELVAEALRRGASGYLLKTCAATELITAVREVLRGKSYVSKALLSNEERCRPCIKKPELVQPDKRLTDRQREVLQLVAEGKTMKEVGLILNITERTAAFHKYRIMAALGAKTSSDLIRYAVKNYMV